MAFPRVGAPRGNAAVTASPFGADEWNAATVPAGVVSDMCVKSSKESEFEAVSGELKQAA